jgi:hypothetical protein
MPRQNSLFHVQSPKKFSNGAFTDIIVSIHGDDQMVAIVQQSLNFDKQVVEKGLAGSDVPMLSMIVSLMLLVDCS